MIPKKTPMARANLLGPIGLTDNDFGEQLVTTLDALKNGDFSARLPVSWTGFEGIVTECVNSIASRMERSNSNLQRLRQQSITSISVSRTRKLRPSVI